MLHNSLKSHILELIQVLISSDPFGTKIGLRVHYSQQKFLYKSLKSVDPRQTRTLYIWLRKPTHLIYIR